jgi:protein-S-isoprenylcysteine O-methyltransferase Ste14
MLLGPGLTLLALMIWAVLHSLLASDRVKDKTRQLMGPIADRTYRLAYNFVGVLTLLPILGIPALLPGAALYSFPQPWAGIALFLQFLALLTILFGLLQTGMLGFLGIDQLIVSDPSASPQLQVGGLYGWVRHPLYTAGLAFIWLTPMMTTSTLALFFGLTLYIYIGSVFEERRLIAEFGEAYREYQRSVPRLIPRPGRRWSDDSTSTD